MALANSVAIIAGEEFGKCQLAVGAIGHAEDPGADYWKEFWRAFYGHKPKLARMAHFASGWLPPEVIDAFVRALEPALTEQRREMGFYVDVTDGRVVTPDEEITEAETLSLIETFGAVIGSYAAIFDEDNPLSAAFLGTTSRAEIMRGALQTREPDRIREAWEMTTAAVTGWLRVNLTNLGRDQVRKDARWLREEVPLDDVESGAGGRRPQVAGASPCGAGASIAGAHNQRRLAGFGELVADSH